LKNILHFLLSFLELDKGATPSCVYSLFLLAAPKNSNNERLKRGIVRPIWQMPCPHQVLGESLNIRRLDPAFSEALRPARSKKMGKSRNFNRAGELDSVTD
ncbi:MAG TPA: hypothetical protein VKA78_13495, partial [Pyrinomonadaceae bacterium]|nr:hypothetical protein [Pyrinomonadaceae bacterium]